MLLLKFKNIPEFDLILCLHIQKENFLWPHKLQCFHYYVCEGVHSAQPLLGIAIPGQSNFDQFLFPVIPIVYINPPKKYL